MKTLLAICLWSVFVWSACEKDNTEIKNDISTTFPFIKEGNEWRFWFTTSDNIGGYGLIYKILSIGEDGYIQVECEMVDLYTDNIYWFADKSMFSDIASPDDNYKLPLLKVNPTLNDTWSSTVNEEGKMVTITRKIISLNDSVQLPDNSYIKNCTKIHETISGYPQYYKNIWISNNDGMVRIEGKGYYEEDNSPPVYFDLTYVLISKSF